MLRSVVFIQDLADSTIRQEIRIGRSGSSLVLIPHWEKVHFSTRLLLQLLLLLQGTIDRLIFPFLDHFKSIKIDDT